MVWILFLGLVLKCDSDLSSLGKILHAHTYLTAHSFHWICRSLWLSSAELWQLKNQNNLHSFQLSRSPLLSKQETWGYILLNVICQFLAGLAYCASNSEQIFKTEVNSSQQYSKIDSSLTFIYVSVTYYSFRVSFVQAYNIKPCSYSGCWHFL